MLTASQQNIVDSLVNEFTKMNQPSNKSNKVGLLDWNEIYSERNEWVKKKQEIALSDQAFISAARIEMERITQMLEDEFVSHFYIHQPENNNINYGWDWYIVPYGQQWDDHVVRIHMGYNNEQVNNASNTDNVHRHTSFYFKATKNTDLKFNSVEAIFSHTSVINAIKKHINKQK